MSATEKILHVGRAAIWENRQKKKILVGQRPEKSSNYPNRWEIPGGKVDGNDTGMETAEREITEETGLHVVRTPLVTFVHTYLMNEPEEKDSRFYGYRITTLAIEALALNPHALFATPPEHQSLEWVSLDEAESRNLMPQSSFVLPYLRERQRSAQLQPAYFFFPTRYSLPISAPAEVR